MTVDEIKAQYSMRDILSMYGITPNRAGFIHCPFHQGDRTASCKIYPKDFHCHACGANGDIFTFVQKMENCSFKDAFKRLGGSYSHKSDHERELFRYRLEKAKETRLRRLCRLKREKRKLLKEIEFEFYMKNTMEVFSDLWCKAVNDFERDMYRLEEINEELKGLKNDGC